MSESVIANLGRGRGKRQKDSEILKLSFGSFDMYEIRMIFVVVASKVELLLFVETC